MKTARFAPVLAGLLLAASALHAQKDLAAEAQRWLDSGQPEKVVQMLAKQQGKKPGDGRLYLLRSTAHFMLGETDTGRKDLDLALTLDPTLRQGWLNRAALALVDKRYDAAIEAFKTAEQLDPNAADNHLNLGATLLLKGDLKAAQERFQTYLTGPGGTPQGYYLVATNYALGGYTTLAVEALQRAIAMDELMRVTARGDANFQPLMDQAAFSKLMSGEPSPPPADAYTASQSFGVAYQSGQGGDLLEAVLSALQLAGERFDPRVEVTERWAAIWGEMRIVVRNGADGQGLVQLSAPAERMALSTWRTKSEDLFRRVQSQLVTGIKRPRSGAGDLDPEP